jgi:acylphosphatase
MVTKRYVVSGVVQDVGYRYFVRRTANRLGIDGFVRNRLDGTAEVVAQSEDEGRLAELVAALRAGPPHASVTGIEEEALDSFPARLSGFEIRL